MVKRLILGTVIVAAALSVAVPAQAQFGGNSGRYGYGNIAQVARDNGYRQGYNEGARDARDRRAFDYARIGGYRNADEGYRREYGDREDYRRVFREGFASGYRDGYYARGGSNQYPTYPNQNPTYPNQYPNQYPNYPNQYPNQYPTYPNQYPNGNQGYGNTSGAYNTGYNDGYERGLAAARGNDRFDPFGQKRYRDGDHGYNGRYGSREEYKRIYRDAFHQGYERGFRDAEQYGRGDRNNRRRLPF